MALSLWLTDRSRYEAGTAHCARDRFLGSHAGPHGYGWQRRASSVPQVTGGMFADILAEIHLHVLSMGEVPDDQATYGYITRGLTAYKKLVVDRGLSNIFDPDDLDKRVNEQLTLLESMVWVWVRVGLPALLASWDFVLIEEEYVSVLGCTCKLGDRVGTAEEHDARGCNGIGFQTRGDAVCQHKIERDRFSYWEFKTAGQFNINNEAAARERVQLVAGVLGAEEHLQVVIDEVYLVNMIKGKRLSAWDPVEKKPVGPKFQDTPLVYGWRKAANPPMWDEDWAKSFNYKDETGHNRKLSRDYQRTGLWELTLWEGSGALSASDYWTRWLGEDELSTHIRVVGPLYRREQGGEGRLSEFLRQLQGEENRWRSVMWALYEASETFGFGDSRYMALLDTYVPQSRGQACVSHYGEECQFLKICNKLPGWEDPALLGYIPRRPHHAPELAQAIERGLLPPDKGLAEEGSEE